MTKKEDKDTIRKFYGSRHLARLWFSIEELSHSYINVPVEYIRLIPGMDKEVFNNDRAHYVGHGIAYALPLIVLSLVV